MSSSFLTIFLSIGVFAVVVLIVVIIAFPIERGKSKKSKKEKKKDQHTIEKDWKSASLTLERHVHALRREVTQLKSEQKKVIKEVAVEKVKNRKLQERIKKEEEWVAKEKDSSEKKEKYFHQLKDELKKGQEDFGKEYSARLKLERECKELKSELTNVEREKKDFSIKILSLETELDKIKRELIQAERTNRELTKENEQKSWVAKAEYEKLGQQLKEKEKQLERMQREN